MPWVVPLIAAGVSAVAGGVTAAQQNKKNEQLVKLQNQQQIDLINKQNEYNSPSAQMERYKQAGINPYFAQNNAGLQSGVANVQRPDYQVYNPMGTFLERASQMVNQWQQMQINDANLKFLNSQTALKAKQTEVEAEKLSDWRFRNLFAMSNYDNRARLLALQQSKLYNEMAYDYGSQHLLQSGEIDSPLGSQNYYARNPIDVLLGWKNKRDQSMNTMQHYTSELRRLEAEFQNINKGYGLSPNTPWYISVGAHLLDKVKSYIHF